MYSYRVNLKTGLFCVFFYFSITGSIMGREPVIEIDQGIQNEESFPESMTLRDVIHFVLENSNRIKIQQIELAKSDTDLFKFNSIYTPRIFFDASSYVAKDPTRFSSALSGNQTTMDKMSAGWSQILPTGTFVQLEVSDSRYDTNAGEGMGAFASLGEMAFLLQRPAIHTGALTLTLSQELLRDGLGKNQKRMESITRNASIARREELIYGLAGVTVDTMVSYWNLAVQKENVKTNRLLLKSVGDIRDIARKKLKYGLSESFQLNQWNAVYARSESNLETAIQSSQSGRREFLRKMNLPENASIELEPFLYDQIPESIDVEEDIAHALKNRPDIRSLRLQMENVILSKEIAENRLLPSVTLNGQYSSRDQATRAQYAFQNVPYGYYPESSIHLRVEYPLGDEGAKVDVRNANYNLEQIKIQEEELSRKIRDEILDAHGKITVAYGALDKAEYAVRETESFYKNILTGFKQGRFSSEILKNSLDALFQARFGLLQAKIAFNVALVTYDMRTYRIWENYDVDIDRIADRLVNKM